MFCKQGATASFMLTKFWQSEQSRSRLQSVLVQRTRKWAFVPETKWGPLTNLGF